MDPEAGPEDSSCAIGDNHEDEWARLIEKKEQKVKLLREKEKRLCQEELHYQREKELLLTQYKQVFPDKADWDKEHCTIVENNISTTDQRHKEAFELGSKTSQQKRQQEKFMFQLREKQARKILAEVDDALKFEKKGLGLETPLLKWYLEIKSCIKMDEEKRNQDEKYLSMTDKMFYHVKYQTKDSHHPQPTKAMGRKGQQSFPGKWLEELSFNTRHKGTCVHVIIARKDSKPQESGSSKSPDNADMFFEEFESYVFSTDPHVTDCQKIGRDLLLQNDQPEKFVKDVVWNYIDTETN